LRKAVRSCGDEPAAPGRRSATRRVPCQVASVHHSSRPWTPSSAEKRAPWRKGIRSCGSDGRPVVVRSSQSEAGGTSERFGLMSRTRWVPAREPSVTHSSRPAVPSSAANTRRPSPIATPGPGTELAGPQSWCPISIRNGSMSLTSTVPGLPG